MFGAFIGVERFTVRKFLGVLASLVGIVLISRLDVSKTDSSDGGSFPEKSSGEIALGDAMAAFSAIMYGVYTIVMKKQVGDESRVNMQLFFGLVGLFNLFLLWPGFVVLHLTGIEPFALPGTRKIWVILVVCTVLFYFPQCLLRCNKLIDIRSILSPPSSRISAGPTPCS